MRQRLWQWDRVLLMLALQLQLRAAVLALRIVAALCVHECAVHVGEGALDAPNERLHGGVFGARVDGRW